MHLHTSRVWRLAAGLVFTAILASFALSTAGAHEHRRVGDYELTVGWRVEPALVEQPNSLDLRVTQASPEGAESDEPAEGEEEHAEGEEEHAGEAQPVTGLEQTLRAEVIFGDRTMQLELRPAFGEPGAYVADLIPTRAGSYIFHITGEINGTQVDEQFNSADGEFSDVGPLASIQFPEPASTSGDLQALVASAQQSAQSARLLALAGLACGLLGLAAGVLGLRRR